MYLITSHTVPIGTSAARLSDYACGIFPQFVSRKGVKKAIKSGAIRVNESMSTTGYWVAPGDSIQLFDLDQKKPKPFLLSLEVIYEDDDLAVINKPAGIVVSGNQYRTIENALSSNLAPSPLPDALKWPKPTHRLDQATSGLLLIAKTMLARVHLGQQFEEKTIFKRYRAICMGQLPLNGQIDRPIAEKQAITRFQVVFYSPSIKNGHLSLLDLYPLTGRTHQLRIHLSEMGYPILGDKIYGQEGLILKSKGLFLSAVEISFSQPRTGKRLNISLPDPDKFKALLDREKRMWQKKSENNSK